jgi:hypothetical protein
MRAPPAQVLSLMLGQAGLHLHTFPEVAFRLDRWTMQGYPCVLDKTPNRQLDVHVSARTVQCLFWSSHHLRTAFAHVEHNSSPEKLSIACR